MKKIKMPPTRDELIDAAIETFTEIPTTTRVRAWIFQVSKKNYVLLKYRNTLDYIAVYESTRAGRKISQLPIICHENSVDFEEGLFAALDVLIPEITPETQNSQTI